MKTWITETGEEIPYNKLTDKHLLNILKFIKRRAKEGVKVLVSSWFTSEDNEPDIDIIYDKEVEKEMDYQDLRKEAIKRKLIK